MGHIEILAGEQFASFLVLERKKGRALSQKIGRARLEYRVDLYIEHLFTEPCLLAKIAKGFNETAFAIHHAFLSELRAGVDFAPSPEIRLLAIEPAVPAHTVQKQIVGPVHGFVKQSLAFLAEISGLG